MHSKSQSQEAAMDDTGTASKKRKRESLQATAVWKQYISPYLPSIPSGSIRTSLNGAMPLLQPSRQSDFDLSDSQAALPSPGDTPPINYIYQKEVLEVAKKNNHVVPTADTLRGEALPINSSSTHPRNRSDSRGRRESRASRGRNATDSLSPSTQLLQSYNTSLVEEPPVQSVQGLVSANVPKNTKPSEPPDTPIFDSLPRKKQKQLYAMIGGLQSGIRSCKVQAESMQKQLDLLQAALGIVDDEDDAELAG